VLNGPQQLEWKNTLVQAFDANSFAELLLSLDDRVDLHAGDAVNFARAVLAVIQSYNRQGITSDLLAAAVRMRPRNPAVAELARTAGTITLPTPVGLESIIRDTNSQLNFGIWLEKAINIQNTVCRIEVPLETGATSFGTGFLVSRDLVMTNWHVVQPLEGAGPQARPRARAKDVRCRFDYRELSDGSQNQGTVFSLAAQWQVLWSPNNADGTEPSDEQLDCALLRLEKPAGDLAAGPKPYAPGPRRGWITLPSDAPMPFVPNTPLFIVQHPQAKPIKLSLDTSAITVVNALRNRVRYTTNTEPGSSGSPCFDENWNLLALHHSGEPNYKPNWNEGIPVNKIVSYMERNAVAL
jgi:hypothetical protein